MSYRPRTVLAVSLVGMFCCATLAAADWPNWRGPNHDGLSSTTGIKGDWQSTPPKVWKVAIGPAFSSFAIVGDRAYTCGTADKKQTVYCLDTDTGEVVWGVPFEGEYQDRQGGDGTRATPAVSDGRVYVLGAHGRLVCLDAANGREVWHRDFQTPPDWGYSASVLIEGDLAIATGNKSLVALHKKTGDTAWECPGGEVGYATPYPFTLGGKRYIVGFMGKQAMIVEAKTGRRVWRTTWETDWNVNAATPIFHDGRLFISSGYEHGAMVVKLTPDGNRLKSEKVWENSSIRAKFQSPVLYEGHLYTSDEVGLKCVEFATGELKWSQRGAKFGTVTIADGRLLVLTQRGKLLIAKATPAGFEPTTKVPLLDGRCWTVPVLHNGRLYARNLEKAVCYDLRLERIED